MTEDQKEIRRLHHFILRLSERLFLAAECLSRVAETKSKKPKPTKSLRRRRVKAVAKNQA